MSTRNPNDGSLEGRVAALEQALQNNPLRHAGVERGMLEFYDQSMLLIRDSNMRVIGVAYVEGRLEGEGTLSWSGPALLDGPVEITNTLRVLAATTLEGVVRLLSELIVEGGKITAGDVRIEDGKAYIGGMVLDPSVAGGALTFPNGIRLEADGGNAGARLIAGDSVLNVGAVSSIRKGASAVSVAPDGVTVNASDGDIELLGGVRLSVADIPTYGGTGQPLGTLRVTNTGRLERADGT